jgi:hypothetical protein
VIELVVEWEMVAHIDWLGPEHAGVKIKMLLLLGFENLEFGGKQRIENHGEQELV